jgi:tetratricopeptide (TPR) repeat protein
MKSVMLAALLGIVFCLWGCSAADVNEHINAGNAFFDEARAASEQKHFDLALEQYSSAVSEFQVARWTNSSCYEGAGDRDEVERGLCHNIAMARHNQALICLRLKRYDDCVEYSGDSLFEWYRQFQDVQEIVGTYALRGIAYFQSGDKRHAAEDFITGQQYNIKNQTLIALRDMLAPDKAGLESLDPDLKKRLAAALAAVRQ